MPDNLLHRVAVDGAEARWLGEAMPDTPKTYGVESLTFVVDGKTLPFQPKGTLNFSDWSFDVFSPDGHWVVLQQDRFGPYDAVRVTHLRDYLENKRPADQVIAYEAADGTHRPVFGNPSWTAPHTFHYEEQAETTVKKTVDLP